MTNKVKLLCVGIGGYAAVYLDALLAKEDPDFEIVGMVEVLPERCKHYPLLQAAGVPLFATMEELRFAVAEKATLLYDARTAAEVAKATYPPYKASGMAYIRFAKEGRELFKLLFMCDRTGESIPEGAGSFERMTALVHGNTGLQEEAATLFHLEMWAYVHGIATMYATKFLDLDEELVSRMLTDAYQGLRKQYGTE